MFANTHTNPPLSLTLIWVWLLFGNELPPLHRLKVALLVLINMEGPVLLEMLREVNRSEEHTSELQSRLHLVCRLLLEKKKKKITLENYLITCSNSSTLNTYQR